MEKIFVAVAWPYASGDRHLGHAAGFSLPCDTFARYHRLKGNQVLMVSGTDEHGTPITIRAHEEGRTPQEVADYYSERIRQSFVDLGVSYDLFTRTTTENHYRVVQDMFIKLHGNGYVYRDTMRMPYCAQDRRFLADRYVGGQCPHCGYAGARGDQCDQCGKPLDALELVNPHCMLCGATPEIRDTEHLFLNLPAFEERLKEWLKDKTGWRANVLNFTYNLLAEGLRGRPITRDIEWGVPVPLEGFAEKRFYVWFDAVIGYLSATIEWATHQGRPEAWREWWQDEAVQSYYFMAKDNIVFHTIIWPSILMGYGNLNLPYDVPANEYLNLEGQKFSTSRNWVISLPDFLSRYDSDSLRYCLTANAPEARDTDFAWYDFVRRNNDELVATWGNLAHRVLTFVCRHFEAKVPVPGTLDEKDQAILEETEKAFSRVGGLIEHCHFRAALEEAMALAREANRYLDAKEPWKRLREDREGAATSLFVILRVIDSLKVLLSPFLPFSSQRLHRYLGYETDLIGRVETREYQEEGKSHCALVYISGDGSIRWAASELPPGQRLIPPEPLFKKLDESVVEEELARLRVSLRG